MYPTTLYWWQKYGEIHPTLLHSISPSGHEVVSLAAMPSEAVHPLVFDLALVAGCDDVGTRALQSIWPEERQQCDLTSWTLWVSYWVISLFFFHHRNIKKNCSFIIVKFWKIRLCCLGGHDSFFFIFGDVFTSFANYLFFIFFLFSLSLICFVVFNHFSSYFLIVFFLFSIY